MTIAKPAEMFAEFMADEAWWSGRREHVHQLANGFEKWLATDWLLWMKARGLARSGAGIEYKTALAANGSLDRDQKQIDLWWSAGVDPENGPWDYVELKVVFANRNQGKLFTAAGWDLDAVSRIDRSEKPRAGALVVVGVGFRTTSAHWEAGLKSVAEAAQIEAPRTDGSAGGLVWAVWSIDLG
jgi:hypothetical protein